MDDDTEEKNTEEAKAEEAPSNVIALPVTPVSVDDDLATRDAHARATVPNVDWDAYPLRPDAKS